MENLRDIESRLAGVKNFNGGSDLASQGIAQINLTVLKAGTSADTFAEFFCPGASAADVRNNAYGATYTAAYDFASGNLVLTYAVGETVTIGCSDRPYRQLMKFTETNSFQTSLIRVTVSDLSQFNQIITPFRRSAFGANQTNNINPNAYRNPQNQQNNIIDINSKVTVDNEHGFSTRLAAINGLSVSFSLFIPVYAKPNTAESQLGL
jgi:hypothetical protein